MPFESDPVSFSIPSNVPAAPSNDVIVLGTDLPAELQAAGYQAAIIIYQAGYVPTATTRQVKYFFIALYDVTGFAALDIGACMVNNASVSQTGVIRLSFSVAPDASGVLNQAFMHAANSDSAAQALIGSTLTVKQGGYLGLLGAFGGTWVGLPNIQNGWSAGAFCRIRKTAVGIVMLEAIMNTPAGGIANNQIISGLPTSMSPGNNITFACRCGGTNGHAGFRVQPGFIILDTGTAPLPPASSYMTMMGSWMAGDA